MKEDIKYENSVPDKNLSLTEEMLEETETIIKEVIVHPSDKNIAVVPGILEDAAITISSNNEQADLGGQLEDIPRSVREVNKEEPNKSSLPLHTVEEEVTIKEIDTSSLKSVNPAGFKVPIQV